MRSVFSRSSYLLPFFRMMNRVSAGNCFVESLPNVPNQIVRVFEPNGDADGLGAEARRTLLFKCQLLMSRGGWVDDQ